MRERERIARELHDTLLQGFQALTLRLQNIIDGMSSAEPQYALIEQELERADAVLVEGRNRVRDLRGQTNMLPLEELFSEAAHGITASFACNVSGTVRQLRFVAHAEIGKIGIEAITNAAQHAQAKNIEVRLAYRPNIFVLTVLDDGIGIDPAVADDRHKAGHFGIVGMRERADVIQGELAIRTAKNSGTTIELAVPGSVAYAGDGEGRSILAYLRRVLVGPLGDLG
jgi:signal transduction histidine kinase